MRIDLKELLLVSMSTAPNSVIHLHKRFRCGKISYLVHCELQRGQLLIQQVKRIRRTSSLSSRLQRRRRRLQRMLKNGCGLGSRPPPVILEEGFTQTTLLHNSVAEGTEMVLESTASQTAHREWISSQVDTSDLVQTISRDQQTLNPSQHTLSIAVGTEVVLDSTVSQTDHQKCSNIQVDTFDLLFFISRDQQTLNPGQQSLSSQTENRPLQSRTTQVEVAAKTSTTQTQLASCCLATQTELPCTNSAVQTEINCQHMNTQTFDVDEEEVMKPHLQALLLIYDLIKNQSDLIQNEVLAAINQLFDLTLLGGNKRRLEEDLPREASLEPLTPVPLNQIGDNYPKEKLISETELQKHLLKLVLKLRTKRISKKKRQTTGPSWNCTMKCKRCDLHVHRSRLQRVSSGNQETQTEVAETKDAVVGAEMGTQTEKERGRWTLKRS
ncbi:uncharacterized protein LOC128266516 [Drosophila gunungcola]|uniref:Uncharacterized protein n=1 Tax=Drosophila gunungcola TaxID=103775 RepID=A0A9P9YW02_9MUSC|nr:uncharacterized protein LOC128266516 [Drosophila gunungcola]KAI8043935.1 hypothetical protein M5D96_000083 [Drosophila gunungcola]